MTRNDGDGFPSCSDRKCVFSTSIALIKTWLFPQYHLKTCMSDTYIICTDQYRQALAIGSTALGQWARRRLRDVVFSGQSRQPCTTSGQHATQHHCMTGVRSVHSKKIFERSHQLGLPTSLTIQLMTFSVDFRCSTSIFSLMIATAVRQYMR